MKTSYSLTKRARKLRQNMTDAEGKLWTQLRDRRFENLKFRRQQPIGRYIVDFMCIEKKLIIEVDGGQHAIDKNEDTQRDRWLEEQGFTVMRFWNHDVLVNLKGVMEKIYDFC